MVTSLRRPILLGLLLALGATPALAQERADRADHPAIVPSLYRALGEAADGFRTGQPNWFVAAWNYPHDVRGPYPTRADAERARDDAGKSYAVFGPFRAEPDPSVGDGVTVVGVTVRLRSKRGESKVEIDPTKVDALFLSPSAADKFFYPYYAGVYGVDVAAALRLVLSKSGGPVCHWARTLVCRIATDSVVNVPLPLVGTKPRQNR